MRLLQLRLAWQAGRIADVDNFLDELDARQADEWYAAIRLGLINLGNQYPLPSDEERTKTDSESIRRFHEGARRMWS